MISRLLPKSNEVELLGMTLGISIILKAPKWFYQTSKIDKYRNLLEIWINIILWV